MLPKKPFSCLLIVFRSLHIYICENVKPVSALLLFRGESCNGGSQLSGRTHCTLSLNISWRIWSLIGQSYSCKMLLLDLVQKNCPQAWRGILCLQKNFRLHSYLGLLIKWVHDWIQWFFIKRTPRVKIGESHCEYREAQIEVPHDSVLGSVW